MTTRRRITCCILSGLLLSSCGLLESNPPRRVVRVKALADPSFRARNPAWRQELRGLIDAASQYYEREFEIEFLTPIIAPWPEHERVASTLQMLSRLKQDFPSERKHEPYDIIVAVTAEPVSRYIPEGRPRVDRIGNCQHGLGNYVVMTATTSRPPAGAGSEPDYDTIALIHELGHIFGAEHVQDSRSIMHENFDYRSEFDMQNRSVILKNRDCPFAN